MSRVYLVARDHLVADRVVGVGRVPLRAGDLRGRGVFRNRAFDLVAARDEILLGLGRLGGPESRLRFGGGWFLRWLLDGLLRGLGGRLGSRLRGGGLRRGAVPLEPTEDSARVAAGLRGRLVGGLHRIDVAVKDLSQVVVADHEPLGANIRIIGRALLEAKMLPDARHREEHAAALASAMLLAVPLVGGAVGDVAVADDLVVGEAVHRLELLDELFDGLNLRHRHCLVVVADALYADRELVDILLAVPHGAPGVEGLAVAIDYAVDLAVFGDAKMGLAAVAEFYERTMFGGLGGMEHDQLGRGADLALGVSRAPVAVRSINGKDSRRQQCRHENRH